MRLEINLATCPYEDARHFYSRAGIALALAVLLTIALALVIARQHGSTRQLSAQLDAANREIAALEQQQAQARDTLNQPQNRGTRDQSAFINSLLAARAFSWTEVFADLEKIMPARIHVVSINPQLKDNQLTVKITVAGDSREKALDLVQKLERSRHFRNPQVLSEATKPPQAGSTDTIEFQLTAEYLPELPRGSETASAVQESP